MKILFFSPHAYFAVHAVPEALVAESLRLEGHSIVTVNCDGLYSKHCLCMPHIAYSDHKAKANICALCKANRDRINRQFGFAALHLDDFVTAEERASAAESARTLDKDTFLEFQLDGIPVARYALYEFWLNHKLSSAKIDDALWDEFLAIFENSLCTYYGLRRILDQEAPDRLTTYNSLYSVNRIACALADKGSIPHFMLHAGRHHKRRLQQMMIFRGVDNHVALNRLPTAALYRERACSADEISMVTEHVRELFAATSPWVYTVKSNRASSADLLSRYGVTDSQKVLLAVMRSNDERLAARLAGVDYFDANPIFQDQFAWLSGLADLARARPDYVIIFRVHPREFPNKRETVTSQNALAFLRFLEQFDRPSNLHINLPEDNLSLHDLFKITDVLLNASSTAGLEASLFGIPVVGIGDALFSFDLSLQAEPGSIDDYIAKIDQAARSGWSFSRVIKAYRWLNYIFSETAIDISDGYRIMKRDPSPGRATVLLHRIQRKAERILGAAGLLNLSSFPEVKGRKLPLKNAEKLTYAILNSAISHIGVFPPKKSSEAVAELKQIATDYRAMMESICAPDDHLFRARFEECITEASVAAHPLIPRSFDASRRHDMKRFTR